MLAIRMQRTGRKGHAHFRMVVQDSRFNPSSGRVVAFLGSYDPHSKAVTLDKEKAAAYLANGAQPTDRVVGILKSEGVKLPEWVSISAPGNRSVKNLEKLRRNRSTEAEPVEALTEEPKEAEHVDSDDKTTADEAPSTEPSSEEVVATVEETSTVDDKPAEEVTAEEPKDDTVA